MIDAEVKAVAALADGARGKPVVTASVTAIVTPAADGGETDETAPLNDGFVLGRRGRAESGVLELVKSGAHIVAVRLPQYVYRRGGSYFVPLLLQQAGKHGVSAWVEGAVKHTSDVDVDDVARFYLTAVERAPAGSVYNCTGETDVTTRQLAEAIGRAVDVPARGLPRAEVERLWGEFLTAFVDYDNRASSRKAERELGWRPQAKRGMLADIVEGSYAELARQIRRGRSGSVAQQSNSGDHGSERRAAQ